MMNGQLKPGYNVQIGTENQFILGYSLHQRPTDTRCLKPHLEKVKSMLGKLPKTVIADAGMAEKRTRESESESKSGVHAIQTADARKLRNGEGYALAVRRMIEPESVFGQMKHEKQPRISSVPALWLAESKS